MSTRCSAFMLVLILAAVCLPLAAQTYTFQAFSYPHFTNVGTFAMGINNSGAVVGFIEYMGPPCGTGYVLRGFKRRADGVFERPIDDPNLQSGGTCDLRATGINNSGEISGYYYDNTRKNYSGFLIKNGLFTSYLVPGSSSTFIYGINSQGDFVGGSDLRPYAFANMNGVVSHLKYPGASSTQPSAISADGAIVGTFGIHGHHQGFLRGPAGQFAPLQIPGAHSSYAYGINKVAHQIVGAYDDGVRVRGFVYDYITGTYTTVEYPDPNIQSTILTGVTSQGVIVGMAQVKDAQGHAVPIFSFIGTPQ